MTSHDSFNHGRIAAYKEIARQLRLHAWDLGPFEFATALDRIAREARAAEALGLWLLPIKHALLTEQFTMHELCLLRQRPFPSCVEATIAVRDRLGCNLKEAHELVREWLDTRSATEIL